MNPQSDRSRWTIAVLLGVGVLVNYFDRVNLTVSHDAITAQFGISDAVYGLLLSAYSWTYALCQLPSGLVLDRFGVRAVGIAATLVWSVASFASAAVGSIGQLFGARFLLGIGEAPTFPANAKAIAGWFPHHERGLPTAMFDAAAKFASAIGVPLIGFLLLRIGWRMSFAFTGILSFLYFVAFFFLYRDAPRTALSFRPEDDPTAAQRVSADVPQPRLQLLRNRKVIGLAVGFGAYNYVFALLLTWLPTYLSRALKIDLLHSFLYTGVPWLIATVTDLLFGGWMIDFLIRRGCNAGTVRRWVLIVGTAMGLGILGAIHARNGVQVLAWISFCIGGLAAAAPVAWSVPGLIAHRRDVGTVASTMNFSAQTAAIVAPALTGWLVTRTHSFSLAFGVAGAILACGLLGYIFLLGDLDVVAEA